MSVDNIRHVKVFDSRAFRKPVHVIGAGATGSYLTLQLAKLGIEDIHVWDFDKIEEHNLANQLFGPEFVGKSKVEALAQVCLSQADIKINIHDEAVKDQYLSGVVFLLTDTMASRAEIFKNSIKFKPNVELMIETRMGERTAEIHTINPIHPGQVEAWVNSLTSDDEEVTAPSDCGARTTIGATASLLASMGTWQFLKWNQGKTPENFTFISMEPMMIESRMYG